jgi:hypothetical protein
MHEEFILVNYNTLLHVSTLLGHLQGESFRCRYTMLHYTVQRECAVDCALPVQCTVFPVKNPPLLFSLQRVML